VVVAVDPANNADVKVGDELVLKCEARGKPTPTITWYKDGQIVSLSGQGTSHTLIIKSASLVNAGTYQCRASNGHSEDLAIVLINVKGEGKKFISMLRWMDWIDQGRREMDE